MASPLSKAWRKCPPPGRLIGFQADALSWRQRVAMLWHLLRCRRCRHELRELEGLFAIVRAEDVLLAASSAEPPPGAYHRFRERLYQQERALAQISATRNARRWLPLAAAVPLIVLTLTLSRSHVAVLQADELLRRAASVQAAEPGVGRKLRLEIMPVGTDSLDGVSPTVRFRHVSDTRLRPSPIVGSALPSEWAAALVMSPFDIEDPLNVAHFEAWRRDPAVTLAPVIETRHHLELRADAATGPLRSAAIVVDRATFRVMRLTLVVAGLGRLDVEEVARWASDDPGSGGEPPALATPPADPLDDRERAELAVRIALHDLHLSPSDGLRFVRRQQTVQLVGTVPSHNANRRLAAVAQVHRSLSLEVAVAAPLLNAPAPPGQWLSTWLDGSFEAPGARARFLADLERRLAAASWRARSLGELSHRYRDADRLSPATQATVARLARLQIEDLRRELVGLRGDLTALIGPTTWRTAEAQGNADWRAVADEVVQRASALDAGWQTARADDHTESEATERHVIALRSAFNALWDAAYVRQSPGIE